MSQTVTMSAEALMLTSMLEKTFEKPLTARRFNSSFRRRSASRFLEGMMPKPKTHTGHHAKSWPGRRRLDARRIKGKDRTIGEWDVAFWWHYWLMILIRANFWELWWDRVAHASIHGVTRVCYHRMTNHIKSKGQGSSLRSSWLQESVSGLVSKQHWVIRLISGDHFWYAFRTWITMFHNVGKNTKVAGQLHQNQLINNNDFNRNIRFVGLLKAKA